MQFLQSLDHIQLIVELLERQHQSVGLAGLRSLLIHIILKETGTEPAALHAHNLRRSIARLTSIKLFRSDRNRAHGEPVAIDPRCDETTGRDGLSHGHRLAESSNAGNVHN